MTTSNNKNGNYQQHVLPGLGPIDSAGVNAARLAYEQERIKTEQERQHLLNIQQTSAQADQLARSQRAQAENMRARLDQQYKEEQLKFAQDREQMRTQNDLVQRLCGLMKTFGQLWFWEEQAQNQRDDTKVRQEQGWARVRQQAANDAAMQQVAFMRNLEGNRHNLAMEGESARHNRAAEDQSWQLQIQRFREDTRHHHTQEFTDAWRGYYQLLETQRANNMRGHNDAQRNLIQAVHYKRLQELQAQANADRASQSRGGCKPIIAIVVVTLGSLLLLFVSATAFVFTHWTGKAQPYDGSCLMIVGVVFLSIVGIAVLSIRNSIVKRRTQAKQQEQYNREYALWMQSLGTVPPPLQQQQGMVPPWMYSQYQGGNQPTNGMWNNGGQPPFPPTF